jgi:hypothetical protein
MDRIFAPYSLRCDHLISSLGVEYCNVRYAVMCDWVVVTIVQQLGLLFKV